MKLSQTVIAFLAASSSTEALKSKKRSSLQRYGWKWPLCRDITKCQCGGEIGGGSEKSGTITVGVSEDQVTKTAVQYSEKQSCMWHITVPKKHTIKMEFDRDYGFDVEYHNFCGFDKVHILSGHYGPGNDVSRIARFCGPSGMGKVGMQPWDGARKQFGAKWGGGQPFWHKPYHANSNKITIGWDSDQSTVKGGFKLKWWAVPDAPADEEEKEYDTLIGTMTLMRGKIEPLIRAQMQVPHRVRDRQYSQLVNVLDKLESAVDLKGPNGEKSCSDMETFEKPDERLGKILSEDHTLATWLSKTGPIVQYAEYYIGKCKNYKWDVRVSRIYEKSVKNLGRIKPIRF